MLQSLAESFQKVGQTRAQAPSDPDGVCGRNRPFALSKFRSLVPENLCGKKPGFRFPVSPAWREGEGVSLDNALQERRIRTYLPTP